MWPALGQKRKGGVQIGGPNCCFLGGDLIAVDDDTRPTCATFHPVDNDIT